MIRSLGCICTDTIPPLTFGWLVPVISGVQVNNNELLSSKPPLTLPKFPVSDPLFVYLILFKTDSVNH